MLAFPFAELSGDTECEFSQLGKCTLNNLIVNGIGSIPLAFVVLNQAGDQVTDFGLVSPVEVTGTTTSSTLSTTTSATTTSPTTQSKSTTPSTTVETTTTKTTTASSKDLDCIIKKRKRLLCSSKNLFTGKNLASQIMNLSKDARNKIKTLDVSYNPNLNQQKLKSIINQLPGLSTLKVRLILTENIQKSNL